MIPSDMRVKRSHLVPDQMAGITVGVMNSARFASELANLSAQDAAFARALQEIQLVRDFVGSPENILGNPDTKHGEIAEHVEVGVRNARSILEGNTPTATFDGVGRIAPTDYIIDGADVQSKFINGARNTLDHVKTHMDQYSSFGRDGNSYYHIPKDTHEQIQRVLNGTESQLSAQTQNTIKEKVAQIELTTGKSFNEVVKPSVSEYREVQQGTVNGTLDKHDQALEKRNDIKKEEIVQEHQASLREGVQAAAIAGVVGGAMSMGVTIWGKYKEGKNLFTGEFTAKDWEEVGINTAKGTVGGAIAGGAIYTLTNYAGMSAPFASAFVSAAKGVFALQQSYQRGDISGEVFMEMSMIACSEAAMVGVATALGQTLIPIPILGAVIGSMAGRLVAEFATGKTAEVANQMRKEMDDYLSKLDGTLQKVFQDIERVFDELGRLTEAAFDLTNNLQLVEASFSLAEAYEVEEVRIVRTQGDLERFLFD